MKNDYLMVNKAVLPHYFEAVCEAKRLIEVMDMSISQAVLKTNISRSTYYKYKDYVFYPNDHEEKRAIFSFKTKDLKGILSKILNEIAEHNGNVLTISQDMPINNIAYIMITADVKDIDLELAQLIDYLNKIKGVITVSLLAFE